MVDDIFRDFSKSNTTLPAVNIKEEEKSFEIEVAVPGLAKKDIKINVENNVLTISSEKKEDKGETKDNYTRKEYSYKAFSRSFNLPKEVIDIDAITAKNYKRRIAY